MVVNPILNDRERYRIINFLGLSNATIYNTDIIDNIMDDIDEFINTSKKHEVRDIITGYLKNNK